MLVYINWFDEQDGKLGVNDYSIIENFNYDTDLYEGVATDVQPSYIDSLDGVTARKQGGIMPLFYKYQISTGKDFMKALGWEEEFNDFIREMKEEGTIYGDKTVYWDTPYGEAKVKLEFDGTGLIYVKPATYENWDIDKDNDYFFSVMVWMDEEEQTPMSFFWYIFEDLTNVLR